MALISLSIVLVVSKEVFKVEPNFLIAFGLSILIFIGSYNVLKSHLECEKCKETFSKGKIRTDTKEKIQEDIKKDGRYIRQAFWVGKKEEFYECENCGYITSKIVKYKEKI